ncbi:MAG: synthase, partial [Actinomycetia bacterium]|nr:synthase [Actinomycetes bacterium]
MLTGFAEFTPRAADSLGGVLLGPVPADMAQSGGAPAGLAPALIEVAADRATLDAYRAVRREVFVAEQKLFERDDADWRDEDPRHRVLVARDAGGDVLGGVRLGPATPDADVGWWAGGRLAVR